jgi:hypothetical protein
MEEPSAPTSSVPATSGGLAQLESYVERLRVQLPMAPPNILDGYVRFFPWVSIVVGAFFLLGLIGLLGLSAVMSPLLLLGGAAGVSAGGALFMALFFGLALTVLGIYGGYLMLNRRATGWWIVGAGLVINLLQSLLHGSALGLIVTLGVAYLHVLVRPRYS